jgi:hypothetical protein
LNIFYFFSVLLLYFLAVLGCSKTDRICDNEWTAVARITHTDPCFPSGVIQIEEPLGSNIRYKLGSLPAQQKPLFINVPAGKYKLVIEDEKGCSLVKPVSVDTITKGALFAQLSSILQNRCAGCHSGNNPHAGIDFTHACDILKHWDRIEARAILGIPSPMPQAGLISQQERNVISEWIKAGHRYAN